MYFEENENGDETTTEIHDYIYAHGNDQAYVDLYSKNYSTLKRLSLMLVGYPHAGKTCMVDTLLAKLFRETQCTNGIDLSICTVTTNHVETSNFNWNTLDQHLYERINGMLQARISNECQISDANEENIMNSSQSGDSCQSHSSHGSMPLEMKIWDMSGEFGFYSTHQMFLSSSSVFLLVMDINKSLDVQLPLSCATRNQTGKIECPKTPREFLDYWLSTVGTFAGHSTNGAEMQPHVIIVLTHTDLIDIDRREHVIDEYVVLFCSH